MIQSMPDRTVSLSANAAARILALRERQQNPHLNLRLLVEGGGCSGFQYKFSLDDSVGEEDHVFPFPTSDSQQPPTLLVDDMSLDLLKGATIDFIEDLMGSYFEVKNPNAASGCGCGTSFAI